jgi:hypothetical protein
VRRRRRFFESFQQRVRRGIVHLLRIIDDEYASLRFVRKKIRFALESSDRIDPQVSFVWHDHANIGVLAEKDLIGIFAAVQS